jgi:hypothetical protein
MLLVLLGCRSPKGGNTEQTAFSSSHDSSGQTTTSTGDIFNLHVQGLTESDLSQAQRIVEGLRSSALLASLLPTVKISIEHGKVILRGVVQSQQQKDVIESIVQRTAGIKNVINELQVSTAPIGQPLSMAPPGS